MASRSLMTDLMQTARGLQPPDVVVRGGRVVNVFMAEVEELDILIRHGTVVGFTEHGAVDVGPESVEIDASGSYVVPGLIDAHYHMGGTHLGVSELATAMLAQGTTCIATDFYEIYTVAGPSGVRYALDEAERYGLGILYLPPAHLIGLENVGTFGWGVCAQDMIDMLAWPEAVGVMEPPAAAVLTGDPEIVRILDEVKRLGMVFAGHHPGGEGADLFAYLSTGASSDHESQTADEALRKMRYGMRAMMRESSAAHDLGNLVELVGRYPAATRYMMLCSDETDPGDLVDKGHMDTKVRLAVDAGVDPLVAIQMASINVAEYFGVSDRVGSISPGRLADLVLVGDLGGFRAHTVLSRGRIVSQNGPFGGDKPTPLPDSVRSAVNVPTEFTSSSFAVPVPSNTNSSARVRVFGVEDGSLVSLALERDVEVVHGALGARPDSDLLKIAVAERHHGSGRVGCGFVEGFGFKDGAVAMTYCHVFQNLLVIGSSDEMMARAANEVADMEGGVAVVQGGEVTARWSLPIVGVMSDQGLSATRAAFDEINEAIKGIGCTLSSPVLSLSFIALPTIPAYGLTDLGLFEVETQRFVDVVL